MTKRPRQTDDAAPLRRFEADFAEIQQLCSALPECDATGKLRGYLTRLHESLGVLHDTGDVSNVREAARAAEEFVQHLHTTHPLTQLLHRLSALNRDIGDEQLRPGPQLASAPVSVARERTHDA